MDAPGDFIDFGPPEPNLAELLGYTRADKLLIVNTDDSGLCHAVNVAAITALTHPTGIVRSTTAMVPCPWFPEFAALARGQGVHSGIHLTTTSEWEHYRWGPVAPRERVPSLVDRDGFFWRTQEECDEHGRPEEIAIELRAQIERALHFGLRPTHVDSHMGMYHYRPDFFDVAAGLAREYGLCLRDGWPPRRNRLRGEGVIVPDYLWFDTHDIPVAERRDFYLGFLANVQPGVTELVIHVGEDGDELRAVGPMWRERSFDLTFFTSPETRRVMDELGITPTGYAEIQALQHRLRD
jgi:hypothetical protein